MYYTHRRIRALTPTCVAGEVASLTSQVKGLEQDLKLERRHALNQEKQLRDLAAKADGASERARALRLEQELANTRLLLQVCACACACAGAGVNVLVCACERARVRMCVRVCACFYVTWSFTARVRLQDKIAHGTALENKLIELTGENASRAAGLHACARVSLPAVRACFGGKRS